MPWGVSQLKFCKNCLMPNTRPRIVFDDQGVCNGCKHAEVKKTVDWNARRDLFLKLVEDLRAKNGNYDCIVPWSGGKDSSTIAYRLKFEFGLNPLLVTFSPLMPNRIAEANREALIDKGFDNILVRPNGDISRYLARRFFTERGDPKVHWHAGINTVPIQIAVRYRIPLIFYAEHGESEYGGRVLSDRHMMIRDFTEVLEHQIGDTPENWIDDQIKECELAPYVYPRADEINAVGIRALYFGYFFRWSAFENWQYIKNKISFKTAENDRTDGTFTNYDSLDDKIDNLYYYLQFIKFGFGRALRDACRMIQNGHMTRDEALKVVTAYDTEFPSTYHGEHLEFLKLTNPEFDDIINQHRDPQIWKKVGNGWRLRYPPR